MNVSCASSHATCAEIHTASVNFAKLSTTKVSRLTYSKKEGESYNESD